MQNSFVTQVEMNTKYPKAPPLRMEKAKYVLLFLTLALVIGCIQLLSLKVNISLGWLRLLQMLAFFGLGWLHVRKIMQHNIESNESIGVSHPILLSCFILVALSILYYFISPEILLTALGSACAFFLPHILNYSWLTFSEISQTEYGVWSKPLPETQEKTFIFFGGLPVRVKFAIDANDRNKKLFKSYAPPDKTLGEFFNHFLLIQRNNNKLDLALLDEEQKPFGWKFFRTDYMGLLKTQIDPMESFEELKLKTSETILATRVRLANHELLSQPENLS